MNTVTVSTTEFEFTHGRKPRGTGFWFFFTNARLGLGAAHFSGSGSFADVKSRAQVWAAGRGFTRLSVGS